MASNNLTKAALLMLVIVIISVISWEYFWRSNGFKIAYNDDEALWLKNREKVYTPADETTVVIGSSRIEFDLDIPTWEKTTSEKLVQLALHGSNPRPALVNLSNDEKFKGKLIVDVTEGLFFGTWEDEGMTKRIKYLKDVTPANRVSDKIGFALESQLVFLDKEFFSMNALLNDLRIPNRKDVRPEGIFPKKFSYENFDRQEIIWDEFVKDTAMQNQVTGLWTMWGALSKDHGIKGDTLQKIFDEVKTAVDKIKARGGKVIFTRTPSSGGYWENEPIQFPRAEYWDKILSTTNCKGIHFKDYPDMANFICPEWSHLTKEDAALYTKALIKALEKENWFTHSN